MGREQIKLGRTVFQDHACVHACVGNFCSQPMAGVSACALTSAGISQTLTTICRVGGLQLVRVGGQMRWSAPWLYLAERRWRTRREQVQRRGGEAGGEAGGEEWEAEEGEACTGAGAVLRHPCGTPAGGSCCRAAQVPLSALPFWSPCCWASPCFCSLSSGPVSAWTCPGKSLTVGLGGQHLPSVVQP